MEQEVNLLVPEESESDYEVPDPVLTFPTTQSALSLITDEGHIRLINEVRCMIGSVRFGEKGRIYILHKEIEWACSWLGHLSCPKCRHYVTQMRDIYKDITITQRDGFEGALDQALMLFPSQPLEPDTLVHLPTYPFLNIIVMIIKRRMKLVRRVCTTATRALAFLQPETSLIVLDVRKHVTAASTLALSQCYLYARVIDALNLRFKYFPAKG